MNYSLPLALILCAAGCDGGGAQVNLTQDQGQNQDQRPDLTPVPTPFDTGCEVRCNKRFDGFIEVIRTCIDGTQSVQILPVLPDDCDSVNNVFPVANDGGGVSGQHTH